MLSNTRNRVKELLRNSHAAPHEQSEREPSGQKLSRKAYAT